MIQVGRLLHFLVFSGVVGRAACKDEPVRPVLALASGNAQLLVRESVTMVCSIPENTESDWRHWWFRDGVAVRPFGLYDNTYTLTPTLPWGRALYACQGRANGTTTLRSLPLKIDVVGGWVGLLVPHNPSVIGENITLTCHVWGNPKLTEVVFFKDGYEVQTRADPYLRLFHVTKADQGTYWCRATWARRYNWHTAQSLALDIAVTEVSRKNSAN